MAETSGFMTDLPQSAYLSLSMKRAISAAEQRSHRYVTLEHLLYALLDDPAATEIFEGIGADLPSIRAEIAETVNGDLATLYTPGDFDLRASYKVERVLQTASDDANRLNCDEVDAAFVIAALSRESDSKASDVLKRNGFSYSKAVTWLYANRGMSPAARAARTPKPATNTPSARTVPEPAAEPENKAAPERERANNVAKLEEQAPTGGHPASSPDAGHVSEAVPLSVDMIEEEPLELNHEIAEEDAEPVSSLPVQPNFGETRQSESEKWGSRSVPGRDTVERRPLDKEEANTGAHPALARGPSTGTSPRLSPPARRHTSEIYRGGFENGSAARAIEQRTEPSVPPSRRIDEMRLGRGAATPWTEHQTPAPSPPPASPSPSKQQKRKAKSSRPKPKHAPGAEREKGRARRKSRPEDVLAGRLMENIPRQMRAEISERIEVRISREETHMLSRGMEGRAAPVRHDIMVTQTMSVALRAPDGGFTIEPLTPETQWIFDRPDDAETYGRWRWMITPHQSGERRLQLIVAARSIGQNGLIGDTALPDQIVTVRIKTNYRRGFARGLKWIAAMVAGGVLTELTMMSIRIFGQ